ncbi:MAG: 4Fe-4S dicluster domain-containing protein [Candidatus Hydrothermarchaeota archaeon]
MVKVEIRQQREECTGCGTCVEVCPVGIWEMGDDGLSQYIAEKLDQCLYDLKCQTNCPVSIIQVKALEKVEAKAPGPAPAAVAAAAPAAPGVAVPTAPPAKAERKDTPGTIVRDEPPDESLVSAGAILALTGIEFVYLGLFLTGVLKSWDQEELAFWLGMAFVVLAFILIFYRRSFISDRVVIKERRRKFEDLLERE